MPQSATTGSNLDRHVIDNGDTEAWWELSDRLWGRVSMLQRMCRRRVIRQHVLPTLQVLEKLYLDRRPGERHRLVGKSVRQIEKCDFAIEAMLYLYQFALEGGFIDAKSLDAGSLDGDSGKRIGGKKPDLTDPDTALMPAHMHRTYIPMAIALINEQASEQSRPYLAEFVNAGTVNMTSLKKFRVLGRYNHLLLEEMRKGLGGELKNLIAQDYEYLEALGRCNPIQFIRPLRRCLGKHFPRIMKWDAEFLKAAIANLNHNDKVLALGPLVLKIKDPAVLSALGKWPVKPVPGGKELTTRIKELRDGFGNHFMRLLKSDPEVIEEIGRWPLAETKKAKKHLGFLGKDAVKIIDPLEPKQKIQLLDGLAKRLGGQFITDTLNKPDGLDVLTNIIEEFVANIDSLFELIKSCSRQTDPSDVGNRFDLGCNIDAITENVIPVNDNVTEVDPDTILDQLIRGGADFSLGHCPLDRDRAFDGVNRTGKYHQQAITHGFNNSTLMRGNGWGDEIGEVGFVSGDCFAFIGLHETGISHHVERQYRGKFALFVLLRHQGPRHNMN